MKLNRLSGNGAKRPPILFNRVIDVTCPKNFWNEEA